MDLTSKSINHFRFNRQIKVSVTNFKEEHTWKNIKEMIFFYYFMISSINYQKGPTISHKIYL